MNDLNAYLETVWDGILSRDSKKIIATFHNLEESDRKTITDHLQRMITEPGWHEEQVISAATALKVIKLFEREENEH